MFLFVITSAMLTYYMQVIGDWVAAHTQEEVLAAMAEARVPSGKACPAHECVPLLDSSTQRSNCCWSC